VVPSSPLPPPLPVLTPTRPSWGPPPPPPMPPVPDTAAVGGGPNGGARHSSLNGIWWPGRVDGGEEGGTGGLEEAASAVGATRSGSSSRSQHRAAVGRGGWTVGVTAGGASGDGVAKVGTGGGHGGRGGVRTLGGVGEREAAQRGQGWASVCGHVSVDAGEKRHGR